MSLQRPTPVVRAPAGARAVKAPFVALQKNGITNIEAEADRRFRDTILALAPEGPRRQFRDAFVNGPKPNGRQHAIEYFGPARVPVIQAQIVPLVEALHILLASRFRLPGFNEWVTLTGFGDDYRFIKGLIAWAEMKAPEREPPKAEAATLG